MSNIYLQSGTPLHVFSVQQQLKKLSAELAEHRYYLERNVSRRTEHLNRQIELLESCNSTLCGQLAEYKKQIAILQQSAKQQVVETGENAARLYLVNNKPG